MTQFTIVLVNLLFLRYRIYFCKISQGQTHRATWPHFDQMPLAPWPAACWKILSLARHYYSLYTPFVDGIYQ